MQTYHKNQRDLSIEIIRIIDDYWVANKSEDEMIQEVKNLLTQNIELAYKNGCLRSTLTQRLGMKRVRIIEKVMSKDVI